MSIMSPDLQVRTPPDSKGVSRKLDRFGLAYAL